MWSSFTVGESWAVDCRGCEVHCDKVFYPSACLDRSCPFVYAYEEHGHTFVG